jgi:aspartyl/asparaginyl-tRNA synthetase
VAFTEEPCVLHWPEAMEILQEKGFDMGDGLGDLTGAQVREMFIIFYCGNIATSYFHDTIP